MCSGSAKAYTQRVARALLPTDFPMLSSRRIRAAAARKFGVNTGPQSALLGWFDAALVRQTVRTCVMHTAAPDQALFLTVLTPSRSVKSANADGKEIDQLPSGEGAHAPVVPSMRPSRAGRPTPARSWGGFGRAQARKYVRQGQN